MKGQAPDFTFRFLLRDAVAWVGSGDRPTPESGLLMSLYRIVAPHFCAGVKTDESTKVVFAAPILGWTVGKPVSTIRRWCIRKGYEIDEVKS